MTVIDTAQAADSPFARALASGELKDVEVSFTDHQGHMCGKRIPGARMGAGAKIAFCSAALAWDYNGDVHDGTSITGPESGYPDAFLRPDPSGFRWLPWREGAGHVISDVVDRHGDLLAQAPRTVLRRAIERIAALGYTVRMGVEIEMYLLDADNQPLSTGVHCYSLQKANDLEPAIKIRDFYAEFYGWEWTTEQFRASRAGCRARCSRPRCWRRSCCCATLPALAPA